MRAYIFLFLCLVPGNLAGRGYLTSSPGSSSRPESESCKVCGVTASSDRPNSSHIARNRPTVPLLRLDCNNDFLNSVTDQAYPSSTGGWWRTSLGATSRPSRLSEIRQFLSIGCLRREKEVVLETQYP